MPINPEVAMQIGNNINSVRGQIDKLRAEYARIKNDKRHKARADQLMREMGRLEKAERRHWDQVNTKM